MCLALLAPLVIWQNFYVIIGSAAATLTGLMFIVVTLVAGTRQRKANASFGAFATPNVVHFCAALFVAALFSAPWQALWNVSLPLGLCGLGGMIYVIVVFRRLRLQRGGYQPVMEDWLGHTIFPLVSYTLFVVAAIVIPSDPTVILFFVGAATIMLLFIGIHNAWDTITYITRISRESPHLSQWGMNRAVSVGTIC